MPTKKQLANFLTSLKKKSFGECTIHLSDVEKFCQDNSTIPEDDDEVFVANKNLEHDDNGKTTMRLFFLQRGD